jgi:hypothetical protein
LIEAKGFTEAVLRFGGGGIDGILRWKCRESILRTGRPCHHRMRPGAATAIALSEFIAL